MGLTDSAPDLIEEHWVNEDETITKAQLHAQEAQKQKEEEEVPRPVSSAARLNEDEVNEEKMWIDAISMEPKSSALRNQLANHYFSQNRLHEAEFAYRAAIDLDVTNSIAHYDYAFMRHHQFYWCLAKLEMAAAYKYAMECKQHYCEVLSLDSHDVETHYQLSLLYLTMLETTLIESVDNIESPLQYHHASENESFKGMRSRWYADRKEMHALCVRHLEITMDSCTTSDDANNSDAVLFGTYITSARLLYLESIPNCFIFFELTRKEKMDKLHLAIAYLTSALEINENDATLHHDLGLILSHELVAKYEDAIYHWRAAHQLDGNNPIYTQQIGYIYQYHLVNERENACKYYHLSLKMYETQSQSQEQQSQSQRRTQACIWNNLGILSAQNAKTQSEIVYATKCWKQCLSRNPNHCEAHRNLGNILWLHFYDENKGEIHLQRAIAISSQVYHHISSEKMGESQYFCALRDKFAKFLSQTKSDYGGLLLMMFKYDALAEKQLRDALAYDENCISAHYYLGKYLFDFKRDYVESAAHLNKYLELEVTNKNGANRAHSHQILGEILLRKWFKFKEAQSHFECAIEIITTFKTELSLPMWAKCKMYCGLADCIVKYYLNLIYNRETQEFKSLKTQQFMNEFNKMQSRIKPDPQLQKKKEKIAIGGANVTQFQQNIERAKKQYRAILKMDHEFVGAPLGLAVIFAKIEGKIQLSEKHYNDSIRICKQKLIKLGEKYHNENEEKTISEIAPAPVAASKKVKFADKFKINLSQIDEILNNDNANSTRSRLQLVREIKEYLVLCCQSHLGKVELIMISCHNGNKKWKEALAHCIQCLYLDPNNATAQKKATQIKQKIKQNKTKQFQIGSKIGETIS